VKLYWRVKRNGKWTWRPARVIGQYGTTNYPIVEDILPPEEEE
jgi:hypothetical protein